jgi:hypothetical protein
LQYFSLPTYISDYYDSSVSSDAPDEYSPEFMWMVGIKENLIIFIPLIEEQDDFLHFQKWGENNGRLVGRSALKTIQDEKLIVKVCLNPEQED